MPKRLAYVGLSGPIAYDYKNKLNWQTPNPILEAPLGLMVLYDEIVFLDLIVCPKSMQKLDFVKFLTDKIDIKDYFEKIQQERLEKYASSVWQGKFPYQEYEYICKTIAPFAHFDSHSRRIVDTPYIAPNAMREISVSLGPVARYTNVV
jgi:hypothetical protein